jgi:hypothetical protein
MDKKPHFAAKKPVRQALSGRISHFEGPEKLFLRPPLACAWGLVFCVSSITACFVPEKEDINAKINQNYAQKPKDKLD